MSTKQFEMKKNKTWAVAYLRTAILENGDFSKIQQQKQEVEKYCIENGLSLKKVFWDVGSGANFNRKGWNDLVEYISSSNGAINFILSTEPSRICRNLPLFIQETDKLKKGYKLKFKYCQKAKKAISTKNFLFRIK